MTESTFGKHARLAEEQLEQAEYFYKTLCQTTDPQHEAGCREISLVIQMSLAHSAIAELAAPVVGVR